HRHLTNGVTEILVESGARLDHTRIVMGADGEVNLGYLAVRQAEESFYASRVVSLGGALTRLDLDVHLEGEGAQTELDGVYHVDRRELVDHQLRVEHRGARGSSRTCYRGLLDGMGHAV